MNGIPIELLVNITQNLDLVAFHRFRRANKKIFQNTEHVPTLQFQAYKRTTAMFGEVTAKISTNGTMNYAEDLPKRGILLRETHRMKLNINLMNESEFLYIVRNGHFHG